MKKPILFSIMLYTVVLLVQSCVPPGPAPTEEVSYANDIAPLMTNYCLTCHSGAAPEAGLNLDNFSDVKTIGESGKLVIRTNDEVNPMPPGGLLSDSNRKKIEDWVAAGFTE